MPVPQRGDGTGIRCRTQNQRVNGLSNPRIFGSAARGEDRPGSDIDLLVDIEQCRSLLDLIAAKQDLEDILGRTVDLVTERSLNPYIRESVIEEVLPL